MELRIVLVAGALLAAVAPTAGAREVIPAKEPFGTPQFAGAEVVYGDTAANGALQIRAAEPGKRSRLLRSFPGSPPPSPGAPGTVAVAAFDAGAGGIALSYTQVTGYGGPIIQNHDEVMELGSLAGRRRAPACPTRGGFLVDAGRVAYVCADGERRWIRVERAATGAQVARIDLLGDASTRFELVGLAGTHLAYEAASVSGAHLVVWSLREAEEVYRVRREAGSAPAPYSGAALGADGRLVTTTGKNAGGCTSLVWFSPAEPRPHPIRACGRSERIDMSGDRIATQMTVDGGHGLGVMRLGGGTRLIDGRIDDFDLDRDRLAYRCAGDDRIVAERVAEDGTGCRPMRSESGRQPPHVAVKEARLTGGRMVGLRLECPGGCDARVSLTRAGRSVSTTKRVAITGDAKERRVTVRLRRGVRVPRTGRVLYVRVAWREPIDDERSLTYPLRVLRP